jgi:hypothetical protein
MMSLDYLMDENVDPLYATQMLRSPVHIGMLRYLVDEHVSQNNSHC